MRSGGRRLGYRIQSSFLYLFLMRKYQALVKGQVSWQHHGFLERNNNRHMNIHRTHCHFLPIIFLIRASSIP